MHQMIATTPNHRFCTTNVAHLDTWHQRLDWSLATAFPRMCTRSVSSFGRYGLSRNRSVRSSQVKRCRRLYSLFMKEEWPKISNQWPEYVSAIMISCWSKQPSDRPDMPSVKTNLSAIAMQLSKDESMSQP